MSEKQTPLDVVRDLASLGARSPVAGDEAVASLIEHLADTLDNHLGLRSYTDDHMSDINEATGVLREIAEGLRP